ncbi:hypothetical protein NHX12_012793 [Muraenolepis orangiensis]|uniref:G-protein coupled receptors family 1 profile domain-containing protein n=1 Tax=Muraenolepis orangiensis TaxID=630683 RepID=A0A9Q0DD50_9TELE|nr:hypothetical protein NHX12_012793 [Muraenolepis orangiensis]
MEPLPDALSPEDPPLLSRGAYTVLAALMGVFSAGGILLNLLVVVVTLRHRQLRQPLNYALVNLALCDLGCAALGGVPTTVATGMGRFPFGRLGCVAEGFTVAFFGIASLCTVAVIAVERYVVVCRPLGALVFQTRHAVGGVVISWLWSFLWNTPPLFGWGSFQLEGIRTSCAPCWSGRDAGNRSYILLYLLMCFVLPLSLILLAYGRLLGTLRKVSQVCGGGGPSRVEQQVGVMVSLMVLSFLLSWLPYAGLALATVLDPGLQLRPLLATAPAFLAKSSTTYNPIIYIFMNRQFRDCTVRTLLCGRNPWASDLEGSAGDPEGSAGDPEGSAGDTAVSTLSRTHKASNSDLSRE